jgi:hypothetical protein
MRILFVFLLAFVIQVNAQTVIDYQTWTPPTDCNIFGTAINVPSTTNSISGSNLHQTTIGQPVYNNANSAIELDAHTDGSAIKGTQYRISYSFKQGYFYSIVVNAISVYSSGENPFLDLKLTSSTSTASSCNGYETISSNQSNGQSIPKTSFQDYTISVGKQSSASSYLTLGIIPTGTAVASPYILIRKITITETPPDLVLSSNTPSITCGSTASSTFTVSNPNAAQNVTGYVWNLGSTSNGWQYLGSAAPATFTTTVNSITLTPICGNNLSNVSVTVQINGSNFRSYSSNVSIFQPTLSISGPSSICSDTSNYSINNLPCNATVNWNVSPYAGVVSNATSGNTLTLTKVANGNVTITATVSGTNCTVSPVSKSINVTSIPDYIGISSFTNLNSCDVDNFAILTSQGGGSQYVYSGILTVVGAAGQGSTISWSNPNGYNNNAPVIWSDQGNGTISVGTNYSNGSIFLRATATNACGSYYKDYMFQAGNCMIVAAAIAAPTGSTLQLYPNPTSGSFIVSISSLKTKTNIKEIIITDKMGNNVYQQKFSSNLSQQTINLSAKSADIYMVKVFDGSAWTTKQLILKY